jgi:hypothetical protein
MTSPLSSAGCYSDGDGLVVGVAGDLRCVDCLFVQGEVKLPQGEVEEGVDSDVLHVIVPVDLDEVDAAEEAVVADPPHRGGELDVPKAHALLEGVAVER